MASVLIVAEHNGGKLVKGTYAALTAGKEIADAHGLDLEAAILGKDVGGLAEELAKHGVKKVHKAEHDALEHYLSESWAKVVADIAKATGAVWIGAAATVEGRDYMPRVAVRLGAGLATAIVKVAGSTLTRPMWSDSVLAEVEITTDIKCFTVRPTEFDAMPAGEAGEVVAFTPELDPASFKVKFRGRELVQSERPPLTEARVIVSGGRGTKGDFSLIEALADKLGGAVGATRAAVDAGWVPNEYQIGQTGKVVAPELYIAAGISGAIQHLAGMKGSKVIVAINKDPEAPIFQVADYGLVADLFKAIPEMLEKLDQAEQ
ncbi:MAG: electron transfer flavoprotein subunit alpha/FixB family protein [Deltaproteobacteria bacterium]|nr:MAG: electron transfer flavoprotein subunit alpha/FixB family protein [Deltaproteobacteria bacterium]